MTADRLVRTVGETAQLLGCSETTVRRMINSGHLRSVRLMGRVVIPVVAIEDLLGIERPQTAPDALVKAFAALVGADEHDTQEAQDRAAAEAADNRSAVE